MYATLFQATYYDGAGTQQARFSDYDHAVKFCVMIAERYSVELFLTRGKGGGIIGQWHNGKVTPEFHGRDLPNAAEAA